MIADRHVDPALHEQSQVESPAVLAVGQHHLAIGESVVQSAEQAVLAGQLPFVGARTASSTVPTDSAKTTNARLLKLNTHLVTA